MKSWHGGVLAATLLAATLTSGALAQQDIRIGNRLIPASSIERRGDRGNRAHTHVQIFVGQRHEPGMMGGLGPGGGLTPAQLRQAYNLPNSGGSQIIAIVDAYHNPNALADFNKFSAQYSLPTEQSTSATASTNKVFQILYGNNSQPAVDSTGGWELEEALDIEWAHAMAPNAKILLVEALDNSFSHLLGAIDSATNYTDGNGWTVKEISNSWGGGEFNGESTYDSHFTSSKVVNFVSAGDAGAPAEYPSASPYVVSAGGTTVFTDASGNFTSESGWSSGGGGPSAYEARPSYQNAISTKVGAARGTPDLSFDGDPNSGASVYDSYPYNSTSYGWLAVGGTSLSSPALAGIANVAAAAAGSFPAGSQVLLATIYSNLGTANFRDITTGNNGYPAGAGWDFVTGVGCCLGLAGLQSNSGPPPPVITGLNPASASAGGSGFTLTVNGTGFASGAVVNWNGSALVTSFVSSTSVTASVPAANIATSGAATITASNPGSALSNSATFTIIGQPSITSLSPSSVTAGSASFTLTVNGSGFVSGATVNWNGSPLTTSFVSGTKITATVPASVVTVAGTATVTVVNPGSLASNGLTFTITSVPAPKLSSLSPSSKNHGANAFTMKLTGSGFVSGSQVTWTNGSQTTTLITTFVSSTQLSARVPRTLIAVSGAATVTVVNPAPGGTSNGLAFTIK